MAIQVRLDLTPREFDLVRDALDLYKNTALSLGEDPALSPKQRHDHKANALQADDLIRKVRA